MGLRVRSLSRSVFEAPNRVANAPEPSPVVGNPDPKNYRIIRTEQFDGALLMEVLYPDCTNYEGRKVLLFCDVTVEDIVRQGIIDPHFMSDGSGFHSPFARFEPTELGWALGRHVGQLVQKYVTG